jgi:DNA-binding transcriptional LysR family regulator
MTSKTILLTDLPPFLAAILEEALSRHPDVTIVRGDAREGLVSALTAGRADAVVVTRRAPPAREAGDAARITNLSVVAIAPDGQSASIHRIRAETQILADVTPQGLVAALVGGGATPR